MKKITVTLTDEAEKVFNEIMYSLPKEEDGTGMCNQSEAICHALEKMWFMEQAEERVREKIVEYFRKLRFDKLHHLGLGDIRLTMDMQEEVANID